MKKEKNIELPFANKMHLNVSMNFVYVYLRNHRTATIAIINSREAQPTTINTIKQQST